MDRFWRDAFGEVLGRTERAFVNELIEVRNAFAHDEPFSSSDTERALDSVRRGGGSHSQHQEWTYRSNLPARLPVAVIPYSPRRS